MTKSQLKAALAQGIISQSDYFNMLPYTETELSVLQRQAWPEELISHE